MLVQLMPLKGVADVGAITISVMYHLFIHNLTLAVIHVRSILLVYVCVHLPENHI